VRAASSCELRGFNNKSTISSQDDRSCLTLRKITTTSMRENYMDSHSICRPEGISMCAISSSLISALILRYHIRATGAFQCSIAVPSLACVTMDRTSLVFGSFALTSCSPSTTRVPLIHTILAFGFSVEATLLRLRSRVVLAAAASLAFGGGPATSLAALAVFLASVVSCSACHRPPL
jgi:hypothetical protein